jgi:pyruvate dehydrogenase E1 component
MKKLTTKDLKAFRDRLYLEIPDSALETPTTRLTTIPAKTQMRSSTSVSGAARYSYLPERRVRPTIQAAGR